MIDRAAIQESFRRHLIGMPEFNAFLDKDTQLASENRTFTPPNPPKKWLRESYAWGVEVLAATNLLEMIAFVQYDCMTEIGKGTKEAQQMAKVVGDYFKVGTTEIGIKDSISGLPLVQIAIQRVYALQGMESSVGVQTWYQLPLRIEFRAYAPNND